MRVRFFLLTIFTCLVLPMAAHSTSIDRKTGVGYAHGIGGPMGLSLNYGLGSLAIEAIVGMSRFSYSDELIEPRIAFATGLGGHFHLLSSRQGALSIGARFNLATGSVSSGDNSSTLSASTREVTQVGFDVPLRVYWFPTRNISIHTEFGVAVFMGADDATLIDAKDGTTELMPGGLAIVAFRHSTPIGQLGLTYWW
ncbi:MAG: hypothetical protein VYA30_07315 [Myxococcota bacterium]|nr:hypothetical protein [Myxococcota bacterium]